ncbi:MAG TPA: hypothetical protein VIO94_15965 [Phenylobacterium sp.]
MGQRVLLQHGKQTARAKVAAESVERLINGYLEARPDGKQPTPIYGSPGLFLWVGDLAGPPRGSAMMADEYYCVAGTRLLKVARDSEVTDLGEIPGEDEVCIATDGANLVVVAEDEIYVWDGTTLNTVTDPDAPAASSVAYTDGFFVFTETDTQQFFISGLQAPLDYDALDFASAEWKPDILLRAFVLRRTLYLFGTDSTEAQQNVGGADFPFAPYQDLLISAGLIGRLAVTESNDTMYWMAPDRTVRRLDGITATRISNHDIERLIQGWLNPEMTVASSMVHEGHLWVVFRNPEGCIVYDQSTELWHERQSHDSPTWKAKHFTEAYGMKLCTSATEGKIFRLEGDVYDEDGDILPFEMVTPYAYDAGKRFSVDEVEVITQPGVGSHVLDPAITLQRTVDGEVFSGPKVRRYGKVGERQRRVLFGPQGQDRQMAFKLRITDPVRRAILGVFAEVDSEAA